MVLLLQEEKKDSTSIISVFFIFCSETAVLHNFDCDSFIRIKKEYEIKKVRIILDFFF